MQGFWQPPGASSSPVRSTVPSAFDDQQLKPLWNFNVGTAITGPPVSYSVGDKQYIAVHVGGGVPWNLGLLKAAPELENMEAGSSLFVFALD
jgi:alcohol dehydrogenase (cytochrome c)